MRLQHNSSQLCLRSTKLERKATPYNHQFGILLKLWDKKFLLLIPKNRYLRSVNYAMDVFTRNLINWRE